MTNLLENVLLAMANEVDSKYNRIKYAYDVLLPEVSVQLLLYIAILRAMVLLQHRRWYVLKLILKRLPWQKHLKTLQTAKFYYLLYHFTLAMYC